MSAKFADYVAKLHMFAEWGTGTEDDRVSIGFRALLCFSDLVILLISVLTNKDFAYPFYL